MSAIIEVIGSAKKVISEHAMIPMLLQHLEFCKDRDDYAEKQASELRKENAELKTKLASLSHLSSSVICDHCASSETKLTGKKNHPIFGDFGKKIAMHLCSSCGKITEVDE